MTRGIGIALVLSTLLAATGCVLAPPAPRSVSPTVYRGERDKPLESVADDRLDVAPAAPPMLTVQAPTRAEGR
jgi:hypothetical protein